MHKQTSPSSNKSIPPAGDRHRESRQLHSHILQTPHTTHTPYSHTAALVVLVCQRSGQGCQRQQAQLSARTAVVALLPQVNDLVLCAWVQVHVSAQLVMYAAALRMEASVGAALHMSETLWCCQPEDATLLAAVCRCHDNCHRLLQHRLVAALCVDVHAAEEAGLHG